MVGESYDEIMDGASDMFIKRMISDRKQASEDWAELMIGLRKQCVQELHRANRIDSDPGDLLELVEATDIVWSWYPSKRSLDLAGGKELWNNSDITR